MSKKSKEQSGAPELTKTVGEWVRIAREIRSLRTDSVLAGFAMGKLSKDLGAISEAWDEQYNAAIRRHAKKDDAGNLLPIMLGSPEHVAMEAELKPLAEKPEPISFTPIKLSQVQGRLVQVSSGPKGEETKDLTVDQWAALDGIFIAD